MASSKVHIVIRQGALGEGPAVGLCGKVVERPEKVFMWDNVMMWEPLPMTFVPRNGCKDCWKMRWPDGTIYGIREREEL